MSAAGADDGRLVAVDLDPDSIAPAGTFIDVERATAVHDLLQDNRFRPAGRGGEFRLRLSAIDRKLVLDVADGADTPVVRHMLSFTPFARLVKDYFLVCESYFAAVRGAGPAQIEAIDMGRRGLHNDGAQLLIDRLAGKIEMDFATARRLFTLVCALRLRGP